MIKVFGYFEFEPSWNYKSYEHNFKDFATWIFFINNSTYASSPQLSVHRRKNVTVDSVLVETPLVETLLVKTAIVETMLVKIVLVEIEYWIGSSNNST